MDACHTSLAQPHILDEIFASFSEIPLLLSAHTAESEQLRTNKITLTNAALTCRAFAEPASAVLWSAMHAGLFPLLSTLSNFKLDSGKGDDETHHTYNIIEGRVSPSEWARFEVLARRIQYLSCWDRLEAKRAIDPSVLRLLVGQCTERLLLPNLRVLKWSPLGRTLEQQLLLESLCRTRTLTKLIFLPCTATVASYPALGGKPLDDSDMTIVARVCRGLRDLEINAAAVENVNAIPPTFYSSFHGLRSAQVPLTQPAHLRELAMLPHLESLVLGVGFLFYVDNGVNVGNTSAITIAFHAFPALRTLEVHGRIDPSSVCRILHTIISPILSAVILHIDLRCGGPEGFIHLMEMLCALPAAQQLRTLHVITVRGRIRPGAQLAQAGWRWELPFRESAGPLLQLHNLQDVSLRPIWRKWSITDDDVRAMQQAWPHIQSLRMRSLLSQAMFQDYQPSGVVDLPALSTLVTFAQNCRNLEVLEMDCREIGEDELVELDARAAAKELEERTGPEPRLQVLIVRSRAKMGGNDVGRLARALHRLFPRLEEIH
ncbi:hypothetical protein C8Q74DRAFT_1365743 [Fomes fomentarius]|nr:hypothetical protein C8Q74DRAFT_1365743 [Fomes fomentarius]